jgi:hypothetical protein
MIELRQSDIHHALRLLGQLSPDENDIAPIRKVTNQLKARVEAGAIEKIQSADRAGVWYRMQVKAQQKQAK